MNENWHLSSSFNHFYNKYLDYFICVEFHCKSPIFYTLEFLSVIFIEIGSNTFTTSFTPRIWEASGVTEVKVGVYLDILFLCCAISFSPSSFSQNSLFLSFLFYFFLFLSFLKLLGYMYVLFIFVNYVWLLENNFNLNQKV